VKPELLCLLLLSVSSSCSSSEGPDAYEYALTWYCISPEGCERTEQVEQIDRATEQGFDYRFTSTQDESFSEDAFRVTADSIGIYCDWLYYLSLFGHDLERSRLCFNPGGFELELSIPNEDPATSSQWVVAAQDLDLF
jgi:hypothetical protein